MMNILYQLTTLIMATSMTMCTTPKETESPKTVPLNYTVDQTNLEGLSVAYFASGCFWCVEAIYESVDGVEEAISGYAGGHTDNPTYQSIGTGTTGHAETVAVYYNPEKVSFSTLVDVFYGSQDPTTIGQRPDFGSQYRSIIFYSNDDEKKIAEEKKAAIAASGKYSDPIVTEITLLEKFYEAEEYHQNYERRNPNQRYVVAVSIPRLKRFQAKFPEILKKEIHE